MDATIGTPPVSPIDIDETMGRMRRRLWTIRSTAAAATVGVVAAGVMFAWPTLRPAPAPSTALPSAIEQPGATEPQTEAALAQRLTDVLQNRLAILLPDAELLPGWLTPQAAVVFAERPQGVPTTYPWNQMRAQADIRDDDGSGFVDVLIGRTEADPNAATYCLAPDCSMRAPMGDPLGVFPSCDDYAEVLDGTDTCTEQIAPFAVGLVGGTAWVVRQAIRVKVRTDLVGVRGLGLILGFVAVTVTAALSVAFSLKGAGAAYPATWGQLAAAVCLVVGGPLLMRALRRIMVDRGAESGR